MPRGRLRSYGSQLVLFIGTLLCLSLVSWYLDTPVFFKPSAFAFSSANDGIGGQDVYLSDDRDGTWWLSGNTDRAKCVCRLVYPVMEKAVLGL